MKRLILIQCIVITFILFPQNKYTDLPQFELKRSPIKTQLYPGDNTIDIKYYKLDLSVTYQPNYLYGRATVNLKSVQSVNSFFLDFSSVLTVDSLLINGTAASYSRTGNKLNISLSRIYNSNELISAYIVYKGVPTSTGYGSFNFGNHNGIPAVYTLSEPFGAPDWFPCKDTPADKADSSDIFITCPSNFYAVSNGVLKEQIDNGNGTTTFKWKSSYPIAQYLLAIAFTNYTVYTNYFNYSPTDSMPVVHYVYPEFFASYREMIDKTPWFLKVYSDAFGLYPFIKEKYGQAQFGIGGGMEHQTVSYVGSFDEGLLVHELAHQWFGDKITCRDWHHIWLNEGFATWCSAYYFGETYGPDSYKGFIAYNMNAAKSAVGTIWVQDTNSIGEIFNGARSYSKGGVVLHMLKGITGDSVFFKIMRSYLIDPALAYGTAVTEDFQNIAENIYGHDLDYFFNEWIYGEKYPKYNISWNYQLVTGNIYNISLTINQSTNTSPQFFTMPVQLKITTTNGDSLITIFNNQQSQTFSLIVKGRPLDLVFDPDNYILKDLILTDAPDDIIHKHFELQQNYPNPFNPSTRISYTVPYRSFISLKIYDILGNKIADLVNEIKEAGYYSELFTIPNNISSGTYFYTLSSENYISTKKMIILK